MRRRISDEERTILKLSCLVYDRLGEYADCSGLIEAFDVVGNGSPNDRAPLCSCHAQEAGEAGSIERERFETTNWIDLREAADRIAVMHSPPNGIRGLAERWAAEFCGACSGRGEITVRASLTDFEVDICPECRCPQRLMPVGREMLFEWVRREIEREVHRRASACSRAHDGCSTIICRRDVHERPPCDACGDDGLADNEPEALADHIGATMGGPFAKGDGTKATALAWELCRAAKWVGALKPVTHEWKRVRCVLQSAALAWSRELVEAGWETVAMRDAKLDGSPVPGWQVLASRPIGGAP